MSGISSLMFFISVASIFSQSQPKTLPHENYDIPTDRETVLNFSKKFFLTWCVFLKTTPRFHILPSADYKNGVINLKIVKYFRN